jgi:uncharacterized protein
MDAKISEFIKENKIATLCVSDETPYCFIVFYTYMSDENILLFKSQMISKHAQILQKKPFISGSILPENNSLLQLKGLQFCGRTIENPSKHSISAAKAYYLKYPMGLAVPGIIWQVELTEAKLTDNSVHFGYKLNWKKE